MGVCHFLYVRLCLRAWVCHIRSVHFVVVNAQVELLARTSDVAEIHDELLSLRDERQLNINMVEMTERERLDWQRKWEDMRDELLHVKGRCVDHETRCIHLREREVELLEQLRAKDVELLRLEKQWHDSQLAGAIQQATYTSFRNMTLVSVAHEQAVSTRDAVAAAAALDTFHASASERSSSDGACEEPADTPAGASSPDAQGSSAAISPAAYHVGRHTHHTPLHRVDAPSALARGTRRVVDEVGRNDGDDDDNEDDEE